MNPVFPPFPMPPAEAGAFAPAGMPPAFEVPEDLPAPPPLPWGVLRHGERAASPRGADGVVRVASARGTSALGTLMIDGVIVVFCTFFFWFGLTWLDEVAWGWDLDLFWHDQALAFVALLYASVRLRLLSATTDLHPVFWRGNGVIGLPRLAIFAGLAWMAWVLTFEADESIRSLWNLYYLAYGYVAMKVFGQIVPGRLFGPRLRADVYERANPAAATFLAATTLATGLIAGASVRGEGTGDRIFDYTAFLSFIPSWSEGWWIPPFFFLLGQGILLASLWFFLFREGGVPLRRLVGDRDTSLARAAAQFTLAAGLVLVPAVSGDYHGIYDSVAGFGIIGLMVLVHEFAKPAGHSEARRLIEPVLYLLLAIGAWLLAPILDRMLGIAT